MDAAKDLDATRNSEAHELVQRFSLEVAPTIAYPNAIHAVADCSRREREIEAAKWRPHFQDRNAAGYLELKKLDVEAKELEKIVETFPQTGVGGNWGYDDVQAAVTQAKKAYESKNRAFSGKAQKVYHDVMCNLDAHSGVLSMVPQGNTYVSVVAGAVKTLVKASVNHRRNIDDLTSALKEVNDEAHACLTDANLVQSEATQIAIAKFYIATFLFYGDAIRWFQSSSPKKIWHSLDDNFSERFKGPLAEIHRLSRLVQRATSTGSGAELRVTRLVVEEVNEDVRAGLDGLARENAELRQGQAQLKMEQEKQTAALERLSDKETIKALANEVWRQAGLSGTALLVGQKRNIMDDRCTEGAAFHSHLGITASTTDSHEKDRGIEDKDSQLTIADVSKLVERLLGSICYGVRVVDVGCPPTLALDQRIVVALERWTLDDTSTLIYLEAAAYSAEARSPQVTVAAANIVESADKIEVPTISFFCDVPLTSDVEHLGSDDQVASTSPPLLGLVYSLIFQLSQLLPPLTNIGSLITFSQVASLKASFSSWSLALRILSKLLVVAPPFLLCVIDGFHAFEVPETDSKSTRELLSVFQNAMEMEHKIFKVLFTDSRRAFSLVQALPRERREIVEGMRRAGSGRGHVPAGRAFVNLRMDMMRNS
ncbi:MAG: hypothetical protein ASARMPRED_003382 [Alectoria sarmentosa]|nr:MAG: hypothetical protein ASARMPRED_003382 [Alectoria sarmentosa]